MSLTKISRQAFDYRLKNKKFDHPDILKSIGAILKKNGGLFKMPEAEESVILLLSGGLDSIVCWGYLMDKYKLKVYPLTNNNGASKRKYEKKSIKFFSRFYQQRYPKLFVPPIFLNVSFPTLKIEINEALNLFHPQAILDNFVAKPKIIPNLSLGTFSLSPILAKIYSQHLLFVQNITIHTIFCGVIPHDGDGVPEQSYTSLLASTLYLRLTTADHHWQYSSPFYEKEIGHYFQKADLVRWAYLHQLPLEKTWSCHQSYRLHCGQCPTCFSRKEAFIKTKIPDKTSYQKPTNYTSPLYISINKLKIKLLKILKSFK